MPRVISVIQHNEKRGAGTDTDPVRVVTQYFTVQGELLAEHDSWMIERFNAILQVVEKSKQENPN